MSFIESLRQRIELLLQRYLLQGNKRDSAGPKESSRSQAFPKLDNAPVRLGRIQKQSSIEKPEEEKTQS